MDAWGRHPSWLPKLKSDDLRWNFQPPSSRHRTRGETSFRTWRTERESKVRSRFYHINAEPRRWLSDEEVMSPAVLGMLTLTIPALDEERSAQLERPWYHGATIDAVTGALSTNLVHLHAFRSSPIQVADSDSLRFFKVESTPVPVYLSAEIALDKHVQPGRDHLFILDQGDSTCLFLILSEVNGTKTFRLLTCCHHVTFEVADDISLTPFKAPGRGRMGKRALERSLFVVDLQQSLHQVLQGIDLPHSLSQDQQLLSKLLVEHEREHIPGVPNGHGIAHISQGLLNDFRGSAPGFLDSYIHCLPQRVLPKIEGDHIEIMIQSDEIASMPKECTEIYEEWRFDSKEWVKGSEWFHQENTSKSIQLRASRSVLQKAVEDTYTFQDLSKLSRAVPKTKETEVVMARRGPDQQTEQDRFVAVPRWPKHILDSLDVDGSTVRITIE
ncbi:hypothetical protein FDECE_4540 [Fusarium decemcellulare]|nr:hypothetical protein FDECE_4540 [Fusarium decemcellulare]